MIRAGLELQAGLCPPSKCCDFRCALSCQAPRLVWKPGTGDKLLGNLSPGRLAQEATEGSSFLDLGLLVFWTLLWGHRCKTGVAVRVELQTAALMEGRDVWLLRPPIGPVSGTDCGPGIQPAPRNAKTRLTNNLPFHFPAH